MLAILYMLLKIDLFEIGIYLFFIFLQTIFSMREHFFLKSNICLRLPLVKCLNLLLFVLLKREVFVY